ncbi:CPBP family intramembrane glutamic endopeptidase [Coxiella burnetii]|uniref:CPBP family intramembrane glutamic endopeptidase n=1 Tax=Coxiella burnetii TaxID=777 RepID=UPI0009B59B0A|nr:CPBP family intramembrane metalloprotease [Coxiella burnetii]
MARGSLQSSFYHFLTGSVQKRRWYAIIVSNFLFSFTHLHLAYAFAYAVLLPGLFWGWLYSRHKTILGVAVSHILIGIWALFILGFGLPQI